MATTEKGGRKRSIISYSFILILVLVLLPSLRMYFWKTIGHVHINPDRLVRWANSSALNNARCQVNYAANACEDVVIHSGSSTAFLACGDPEGRTHWYPPACVRDASSRPEASFREQLFKYDIHSKRTTELEIIGLDGDFVTHGLDVYSFPNDSSKVHIFAVSHARDGDSIAIFSHTLGSDFVELVTNVKHSNIKTANGIVANGPMDFFITNDHYFASSPLRKLEEDFGPWSWASHVQYCDASTHEVVCRQVSETFPGANGIAMWRHRMFVGDSKNGTVSMFNILPNKRLEKTQLITLGAAADNIKIIPTSGDLIISVFPTLEDLPRYLNNVRSLGKELRVPAAALRLRPERSYEPELLYYDDGSILSDMTAAALDPYNNVLIGAAVLQYGGFAVCELPSSALDDDDDDDDDDEDGRRFRAAS